MSVGRSAGTAVDLEECVALPTEIGIGFVADIGLLLLASDKLQLDRGHDRSTDSF